MILLIFAAITLAFLFGYYGAKEEGNSAVVLIMALQAGQVIYALAEYGIMSAGIIALIAIFGGGISAQLLSNKKGFSSFK